MKYPAPLPWMLLIFSLLTLTACSDGGSTGSETTSSPQNQAFTLSGQVVVPSNLLATRPSLSERLLALLIANAHADLVGTVTAPQGTRIELVADNQIVGVTTTDANGRFEFNETNSTLNIDQARSNNAIVMLQVRLDNGRIRRFINLNSLTPVAGQADRLSSSDLDINLESEALTGALLNRSGDESSSLFDASLNDFLGDLESFSLDSISDAEFSALVQELRDATTDSGRSVAEVMAVADAVAGSVTTVAEILASSPRVATLAREASLAELSLEQLVEILSDIDLEQLVDTAVDRGFVLQGRTLNAGLIVGETQSNRQLRFNLTQSTRFGQLTFDTGTGDFVYTPDPSFFGTDNFSYTVRRGQEQASGRYSISVISNRALPDLTASTLRNTEVSIPLPTGLLQSISNVEFAISALPSNGSIRIDNGEAVAYIPNPDFVGQDIFAYRLEAVLEAQEDDDELIPIPTGVPLDFFIDELPDLNGTITVQVSAPNLPPSADDQSLSTKLDTPISGRVTGDDPDSPLLEFSRVRNVANGRLEFNAERGSFTYTPNPGFIGQDSFTFVAFDGFLSSPAATVTIDVRDSRTGAVTRPLDIVLDPVGNSILVTDLDLPGVHVVSRDSGTIESFSDPSLTFPIGICLQASSGLSFIVDGNALVASFNPRTASFAQVSAPGQPGFDGLFFSPTAIECISGQDLLVTDNVDDALIRVNSSSGEREVIVRTTPLLLSPLRNPENISQLDDNRVAIADSSANAVIEITLDEGSSRRLSDIVTPDANNRFNSPTDLALFNDQLLVLDAGNQTLFQVDINGLPNDTLGTRSILSDNNLEGGGIHFTTPTKMTLDREANQAIVLDGTALISVDLATGQRALISDFNLF